MKKVLTFACLFFLAGCSLVMREPSPERVLQGFTLEVLELPSEFEKLHWDASLSCAPKAIILNQALLSLDYRAEVVIGAFLGKEHAPGEFHAWNIVWLDGEDEPRLVDAIEPDSGWPDWCYPEYTAFIIIPGDKVATAADISLKNKNFSWKDPRSPGEFLDSFKRQFAAPVRGHGPPPRLGLAQ